MNNEFKKCHLFTMQEIAVSKQGRQAMPLKQGQQVLPLSTEMTHTYWTSPSFFQVFFFLPWGKLEKLPGSHIVK
ncbi:MAG: hypothetical protein IJ727_01500 [Treponema sp.]|nr:hypothetical protein [Treponema sp.]